MYKVGVPFPGCTCCRRKQTRQCVVRGQLARLRLQATRCTRSLRCILCFFFHTHTRTLSSPLTPGCTGQQHTAKHHERHSWNVLQHSSPCREPRRSQPPLWPCQLHLLTHSWVGHTFLAMIIIIYAVLVHCCIFLHVSWMNQESKSNRFKAGQTYLPSGHGGMRVQPAGVYIGRIPQSHKWPCVNWYSNLCSLEYRWIERFAVITAY